MRRIGLLGLMLLLLPVTALADTIVLRNGSSYQGAFIRGTQGEITFGDQEGHVRHFATQDVESIEFGPAETGTVNPNSYPNAYQNPTNGPTGAPSYQVVPIGTVLDVRTNEKIDSKTYVEGQRYSAELAQPVVDNSGTVIIPRDSEAELVIRRISTGGGTGTPKLVLDLDAVTVNGNRYIVSTTDVEQHGREGLGKNKRTGEMVGGGAALGALIGAIAGHGSGAAIGAVAGAGAGAAAEVITKGQEVRVPAETVLRFRLDRDLNLQLAN